MYIYWDHEIDAGPRTGDSCGRRRRPPAQADNTQCTEKREMRNERTFVANLIMPDLRQPRVAYPMYEKKGDEE